MSVIAALSDTNSLSCEPTYYQDMSSESLCKYESQCKDYFLHSEDLDDVCLYAFFMCYFKARYDGNPKCKVKQYLFLEKHVQHLTHAMREAREENKRVPMWFYRSMTSDQNDPEEFAKMVLCLLKPWRRSADLI